MSHPLVTPRVMWQRVPLRVPRALLSSQEAPEDDPQLGALSLQQVEETASERVCVWGHIIMCVCFTPQVCEGKKRVLFVGISCGLSVSHWYYVCLHMKIIWGKNTNFCGCAGSICGRAAGLLPAAPWGVHACTGWLQSVPSGQVCKRCI